MTWLARARIEYEAAAGRGLRDSHDWHQAVWDAFPGRPEGHARPFLFRTREKDEGIELLILGQEEPAKPVWISDGNWAMKRVQESFLGYRRYRFDLLANPTRRDESRDCWNGRERVRGKHRRFNLNTVEEHRDWLQRKAAKGGFRVLIEPEDGLDLEIAPRRDFRFRRQKHRGLHVGVCYMGCLEVTDPKTFAETFRQGIGSAKGFGFGLLLLSPIG